MQKLGNPSSRQVTFTKRKDGIVKKATELSILCGADVGLIMFSPKGRSITFASGGRVEDIFIRWIAQAAELTGQGPICDGGYLTESLKHLKCEQEMLEKIERSGFSSPLFFSVEMIVTHTCFLFSGCFCLINSLSLSLSSC
ncbi:MADS-box protein SOC1-like isoform X1 [Vitis vinifera]|uniref:MADS-box protein SOC1-like isoform X1 n=1 Tax=Vitis vinifera TaxID=29760 RepID=UPI00288340AD|nr:MADS-box protein SOC1-like isoform X1 [Vitis vinifera]